MPGKLYDLIAANFGKAAFYTEEERERYGGVNLNCCERILRGANIAYDLGMREEDMRVSAAFGGGMGIGSTCGAIAGALMVLSMKYAARRRRPRRSKRKRSCPSWSVYAENWAAWTAPRSSRAWPSREIARPRCWRWRRYWTTSWRQRTGTLESSVWPPESLAAPVHGRISTMRNKMRPASCAVEAFCV